MARLRPDNLAHRQRGNFLPGGVLIVPHDGRSDRRDLINLKVNWMVPNCAPP
ncbi:MAG TPA: hypothetical protein VNR89_02755 [Roseomonas sp.]|nr:hypothetical protein [Roseomonas sp.]